MALKNHLLAFLSIAIMATSIAEAQLPLPAINVSINGTVPCALGSNGTPPPFPNATVVLRCPPLNVVIASTTTSSSGSFNLTVIVTPFNISNLLNCKVVVTTPLNSCNPTLPATGTQVSTGFILARINVINGTITIVLKLLGFIFLRGAISN